MEKTSKELIVEIAGNVHKLTTSQEILEKQVGEIHTELKGTPYDPDKGLVPQVKRHEKHIVAMKRKQDRRDGAIVVISLILTFGVTFFLNWILSRGG